jgi:hypothetical protein
MENKQFFMMKDRNEEIKEILLDYINGLSLEKLNKLLYHFGCLESGSTEYDIVCDINLNTDSIENTIKLNEYLIEGFRIACPRITMFADLVNYTYLVIKLNWKIGDMYSEIYNKDFIHFLYASNKNKSSSVKDLSSKFTNMMLENNMPNYIR